MVVITNDKTMNITPFIKLCTKGQYTSSNVEYFVWTNVAKIQEYLDQTKIVLTKEIVDDSNIFWTVDLVKLFVKNGYQFSENELCKIMLNLKTPHIHHNVELYSFAISITDSEQVRKTIYSCCKKMLIEYSAAPKDRCEVSGDICDSRRYCTHGIIEYITNYFDDMKDAIELCKELFDEEVFAQLKNEVWIKVKEYINQTVDEYVL